MDRFSEQLLAKLPGRGDFFKRGLIIAGEMLLLAIMGLLTLWSGFTIIFFTVVVLAGSVWLVKYLWEATCIEYEYIVTNDDLDIDKIIGKRKRKRLITVSLVSVEELAPYLNETELKADVTVVAHDNTGEDMWYLTANTDKYGKLAVLFNPNKVTRENILGGMDPRTKAKLTQKD